MTRIVTMQDISCVGQCSLTVALPILSACGIETSVLPSAVLSTHTGGFQGFTFRDLTEDIPAIQAHWMKEGIRFDALYTGYLGNLRQIALVKSLQTQVLKEGAWTFIDPAMADQGKLYVGFDAPYVEEMKTLLPVGDVILPNITEACFLTDTAYQEKYDEAWIFDLCDRLINQGARRIVLTGVSYRPEKTGVLVYEAQGHSYYEHPLLTPNVHGTGDIYASAFIGAVLRGRSLAEAARLAADFTVLAMRETYKHPEHWYGACFEPVLGDLVDALRAVD